MTTYRKRTYQRALCAVNTRIRQGGLLKRDKEALVWANLRAPKQDIIDLDLRQRQMKAVTR